MSIWKNLTAEQREHYENLIINILIFVICVFIVWVSACIGFKISDGRIEQKKSDSLDNEVGKAIESIVQETPEPTPYSNGSIVHLTTGPDCFEKLIITSHIESYDGIYYTFEPVCKNNMQYYNIGIYQRASSFCLWDDEYVPDAICPCGDVKGDNIKMKYKVGDIVWVSYKNKKLPNEICQIMNINKIKHTYDVTNLCDHEFPGGDLVEERIVEKSKKGARCGDIE